MAFIKTINGGGLDLNYWHLFQLKFDYPGNSFRVEFNGYLTKKDREDAFNNVDGARPMWTSPHTISRETANLVAAIIYADAKRLPEYTSAEEDAQVFVTDPEENPVTEEVRTSGILESIKSLFRFVTP